MDNVRLPALNQVKVFESAARHLSFKKAASELCVTPPAVSHQIKLLEEQLGVQLFKRSNREIELTREGRFYFEEARKALDILKKATIKLSQSDDRPRFVINTLPSISCLLLVPNIHEFQEMHPSVNIQVVSDASRADFNDGETDVAIRHQLGDEPDLVYIFLDTVSVSPICSPEFFESHPELASCDLSQSRLIRLTADPYNWDFWLKQWDMEKPEEELLLNSFHASLEATNKGIGVAMGYVPLIKQFLARNELVLPMPDKVSDYGKMYLVFKQDNIDQEIFRSFEQWLKNLMSKEWIDK